MGADKAGRASILIVEDDQNLCKTLELILEKKGFDVEAAGTGRQALEKAQERFFNVVLLDLNLPDKEGVSLISPLTEIHPEMEVIVTTGQATLDTAVKALNEGAAAYVTKPLDMDDVLARIGQIVEKQHLSFENRRLYLEAQREIEERKQAEEELQASKRLLQTVFDTIPHTMVIKDRESRYTNVNKAWYDFYGLSPEEVLNKTSMEILGKPEEDRINVQMEDQMILSGDEPVRIFEHNRFNHSGEKRSLQNIRAKIRDEEDNVVGLVAIALDITERKQLEAQFQQAQKMETVGTLAGGIAHNFNNLLQMIMNNISLLLMETNSSHPQYEIMSAIKNRVKSGSELTKQLLGFARGGKYQVESTNLSTLLLRTSYLFGSAHAGISIHKQLETELWNSKVDQSQIEQVLLNLFVNSQEAMPHGGQLYVQSENVTLEESFSKLHDTAPGRYVKLSVTDTGIGMDQEILGRIFEPFYTTKEIAHGSGLGLASAYGIIKNHEGIITVDSEAGKGTTFDIYLPAIEEEIVEIEEAIKEGRRGKGTILFVDDDKQLVATERRLLSMRGYDVLVAFSGDEGLEIYEKNMSKIDLVVLDMIMPHMGGGEIFDKLRELEPNVKVLLSSGYALEGEAAEIMERGCDAFIQKPFDPDTLFEQIHELLGQE